MEKEHILPLIFFSFLLLKLISGADDDCLPASCGPSGPLVGSPFRILGRQPSRCGFPGFDLSCDKQNQTILRLPSSRSYIVYRISYASQVIRIDPEFCQSSPIDDLNLTGTPFVFSGVRSYSFYNCSLQNFGFLYPAVDFRCPSSANYSIIAVREGSERNMPASCQDMTTVAVPIRWNRDNIKEVQLLWNTPYCSSCEMEGRVCKSKSDDGQTVCLLSSSGFPGIAVYGLSIGIGVPVLLIVVWYTAYRVRKYRDTQHQTIDLLSVTIIPQPPSSTGLDGPTIETYPKTVIGESCRLPNDDGACSICLSNYKPKECLRTIPECNHYFHVDCIDKWLKLNGTCPVCRNSLETSSLVTLCSSTSSTSADSF